MLAAVADTVLGLALLPIIGKRLGSEAVSYWLLMGTIGSGLLLIQGGVVLRITRSVAEVCYVDEGRQKTIPVQMIVSVASCIGLIACIMIFGALVCGAFYFPKISRIGSSAEGVSAWYLYASGLTLNVISQCTLALINGVGKVGRDKMLRLGSVGIQMILLYSFEDSIKSLQWVSGVYCTAAVICCLATFVLVNQSVAIPRGVYSFFQARRGLKFLFDSLGLQTASVCGYITCSIVPIYLQSTLGTSTQGEFTAPAKFAAALVYVATLSITASLPRLTMLSTTSQCAEYRKLAGRAGGQAIMLYLLGAATIAAIPADLRQLLSGGVSGDPLTWCLVGAFYLLYLINSLVATALFTMTGRAPLFEALINALLAVLLVPLAASGYGVNGATVALIAASTPSVILLYHRLVVALRSLDAGRSVAKGIH